MRLFTHWMVVFWTWKIPSGVAARMVASCSFWALVSRSAFFRRMDCLISVTISATWGRRSPVAGTVISLATDTSSSAILPLDFAGKEDNRRCIAAGPEVFDKFNPVHF